MRHGRRSSLLLALAPLLGAALFAGALAPPPARADASDDALFAQLVGRVAAQFDSTHGGFAEKGAPSSPAVTLALAIARDRSDALWQSRATQTILWTWTLFDSVGGGYFDQSESTRHDRGTFEKRTIPNAERFENLMDAWRTVGDTDYRRRAAKVADFFDRVLLDARGGFVDGQVGDRDLVPESNGLAIHAWLMWAATTGDPRVRDFALRSLDRAWTVSWTEDIGMLHRDTFGDIQKAPQLMDQVEMGRAYVLAAHLGGRAGDLERAKAIGDRLRSNFEDMEKGGWRTQAVLDRKKTKIKNAARVFDENARAARFLCELASVTGDNAYRDAARRGIRAFADDFAKADLEAADWALAVRALDHPELPERPEWKLPESTPTQPRVIQITTPRRKK
ncbi:MAG TPA: hypothetical protein VL332_03880 [Candidatus Saccharimonadaceae bacterium]|jgi:uncharacterized protein YyaL (SSP411 family)|nr:hypothetical protein [Candidatus Saccharimonadaceae bacterium]